MSSQEKASRFDDKSNERYACARACVPMNMLTEIFNSATFRSSNEIKMNSKYYVNKANALVL